MLLAEQKRLEPVDGNVSLDKIVDDAREHEERESENLKQGQRGEGSRNVEVVAGKGVGCKGRNGDDERNGVPERSRSRVDYCVFLKDDEFGLAELGGEWSGAERGGKRDGSSLNIK